MLPRAKKDAVPNGNSKRKEVYEKWIVIGIGAHPTNSILLPFNINILWENVKWF